MIDQNHIDDLFRKYVNNTCTPEESRELMGLFQSDEGKAYLNELIARHLESEDGAVNANEPALNRVFNRLHLEPAAQKKSSSKTLRLFLRGAAAAVLLVALSTIAFRYFHRIDREPVAIAAGSDVAPGGHKATLTLSNGSTIVLNDAEGGVIAQDSGTTIYKTQGGQLVYEGNANNPAGAVINTVATPVGGQFRITLPDGTRVWLNASSSLAYPTVFDEAARKVVLKGEGYFEVAHKDVPFYVETAGQKVEVLGTHFNINSYADELTANTTLLEGSVRVSTPQGTTLLRPGQQSRTGNGAIVTAEVDAEAVIDWKNGDFIFADEDLKSIMRKVSRWYGVKVVFEKQMPSETFSGQISRSKNLSEVLRMLALSGDLKTRVEDGTLYLSSSR